MSIVFNEETKEALKNYMNLKENKLIRIQVLSIS